MLCRLSTRAVAWAAGLPVIGSAWLAERLYRYHSLPCSDGPIPLPDAGILARAGGWSVDRRARGPWLALARRQGRSRWKLYLSPPSARLAEIALAALPVLARAGATSAKLGRVPETVLRPDKFVAYFPDLPSLQVAASDLISLLHDVPAHGVPFTCQLDLVGLISYGRDPEPDRRSKVAMSWRQLVTRELGHSLALAHSRGLGVATAARFALRRLPLAGVDPARFAPQAVGGSSRPRHGGAR